MSTIFKDMSLGCGRSLVIRVIAAVVVIPLACLFIFVPLALVSRFNGSPWLLAITSGVFLVILFGGGAAFVIYVLTSRKKKLDAVFTPLGLSGKAYMSFFRQYHGQVRERQFDVFLSRGPRLEIEIGTSLQTRLGVTGPHKDTQFMAGLINKPLLEFNDPNLLIFAHDEAWVRALLAHQEVIDILHRLTALETTFTRQQVILRPGAFQLLLTGNTKLLGFDLDPAQVQGWVNDLLRLAYIAEYISAPLERVELSSAEQLAQRLRKQNPYLALWVGLGTVGFFVILSIFVAILVFILTSLD